MAGLVAGPLEHRRRRRAPTSAESRTPGPGLAFAGNVAARQQPGLRCAPSVGTSSRRLIHRGAWARNLRRSAAPPTVPQPEFPSQVRPANIYPWPLPRLPPGPSTEEPPCSRSSIAIWWNGAVAVARMERSAIRGLAKEQHGAQETCSVEHCSVCAWGITRRSSGRIISASRAPDCAPLHPWGTSS